MNLTYSYPVSPGKGGRGRIALQFCVGVLPIFSLRTSTGYSVARDEGWIALSLVLLESPLTESNLGSRDQTKSEG